eukprot:Gb_30113 [translate_table: standard]
MRGGNILRAIAEATLGQTSTRTRAAPRTQPSKLCSFSSASCELSNNQEYLESCNPSNDWKSTESPPGVETSQTGNIPEISDKLNSRDVSFMPSNDRLMLIDGTAIMYRAYYKLLGSLANQLPV